MSQTYKISTGRGGAGNITTSDKIPSPKIVLHGSQTPNILQPVYSTGRGGAGNMRRNLDAKLTRKAQDVGDDGEEDYLSHNLDDDIIAFNDGDGTGRGTSSNNDIAPKSLASNHNSENSLKPKKSVHEPPKSIAIGRGGAGNILSPSNSKRSTGSKKSGKAGGKKKAKSEGGLWSKVKKIFK